MTVANAMKPNAVTEVSFEDRLLISNCDEFNAFCACITVGANIRVLAVTDDGYELFRPREFFSKYDNRTIRMGNKFVNVAEAWWKHPLRRTFDRIVFAPGQEINDGTTYNAWDGWGVEPKAGDCSLYLAHLYEIVCSENPEHFNWLIAWLANIVQDPRRKPGTAVILTGGQGTGKSIIGRPLAEILTRRHYATVAGEIPTRFNAILENRLLLQVEEGAWAGNKSAASPLKHLITGDTIPIERKGVDSFEVRNFMRVLMTSNEKWVIPAQADSRRFTVFEVSDRRRQDKQYFAAICRELDEGGTEALLHFLLNFKYEFETIQCVPQTNALAKQKRATLDGPHAWWLDVLTNGTLPGDGSGSGLSPNDALYRAYIERAIDAGERHRGHQTELGIMLRELYPEISARRLIINGKRAHARQFPTLAICRARFIAATGIDRPWDDDDAEWGEA